MKTYRLDLSKVQWAQSVCPMALMLYGLHTLFVIHINLQITSE